ncbi:hypothetical protein FIBSPDRAFT_904780 [Athelia psychrophila]|uniref:DUF6533 domain-containing protein n=1 Tax=Athelia psychrophila TaxID=1759441 RepID=A0A167UAX0_9AGAM|nr:hypothetical protein FIBSPDRAFT_904780 [Fibularhizoctonia sp. CBS 109695]
MAASRYDELMKEWFHPGRPNRWYLAPGPIFQMGSDTSKVWPRHIVLTAFSPRQLNCWCYLGLWSRMDPKRHTGLIDMTPTTPTAVQQLLRTRTATYITVCALTIVAWDWTLALGEELRIAKRCRRSPAALAYFLARTSGVMVFVLALVFLIKVPPDQNSCLALFIWICLMNLTGSAAKAYLFLLRVRAIYDNSKLVVLLSGVGWLVVYQQPFKLLLSTHMGKQRSASDTDSSVRLASHANLTGTPRIASFIRGYGLPPTMRHLLQDGQKYYGITVLFILIAVVIAVSPVNPIYKPMSLAPAFAIETVMTCKVFRAMILRSLHPIQAIDLSVAPAEAHTTAMSIFELDTVMELRIRRTNTEHELTEEVISSI